MSYGLIYTIPFASNSGKGYQVNIEKEDYTGNPTELQGAESPFTVDIDEPDNDFRYHPIIGSTAKIKLVGNDYLQGLYSDNYQEYRVTLYKGSSVIWCGFIKPENYTQDYNSDLFELDIDCLSAMNVLQYIKYMQQGENEKVFITFWDLLKYIIATSKSNYQAIYIPHVYGDTEANYTAYDNVLAKMKISEANFFDDLNNITKIINDDDEAETISDENPWKVQSVLEEMCRFLNWTCVDWNGSLYFIDQDWKGEYLKYTTDLSSYTIVSFPAALNVQTLGFAGSDHTLDILPGYNKVTVKTSNYSASDVFPSESFDDLTELETIDYSHDKDRCRKIFLQPNNWNPILINSNYSEISDLINLANRNSVLGAQLIKRANYAVDDNGNAVERGTATAYKNYSYEDLIQVNVWDPYNTYALGSKPSIFKFTGKLPCVSYADGAISLNFSAQEAYLNDTLSFGDEVPETPTGQWPNPHFIFLLKIGNYYYNGNSWTTTKSTFTLDLDYGDGYTSQGDFLSIMPNKTLSMPYNGLTGYIIPLPSNPISGELIFELVHIYTIQPNIAYNLFIKDLSLTYQLKDGYSSNSDTDRVYENLTSACEVDRLDLSAGVSTAGNIIIGLDGTNFTVPVTTAYSTKILLANYIAGLQYDGWVVNHYTQTNYLTFTNKEYGTCVTPTINFGSTGAAGTISVALAGFGTYFANELDEITEKISSYMYDGLCYSKVLLNDGYLTNNLYSAIEGTTVRPEEQLIRRIINFYNDTKIKLTQVLKNEDSISPLSTFTDSYMSGKTFSMCCGSIDFENDSFSVIMIEQ